MVSIIPGRCFGQSTQEVRCQGFLRFLFETNSGNCFNGGHQQTNKLLIGKSSDPCVVLSFLGGILFEFVLGKSKRNAKRDIACPHETNQGPGVGFRGPRTALAALVMPDPGFQQNRWLKSWGGSLEVVQSTFGGTTTPSSSMGLLLRGQHVSAQSCIAFERCDTSFLCWRTAHLRPL